MRNIIQTLSLSIGKDAEIATDLPNRIVTDSRQATEGSVFVAIKGERVDGHQFIPAVLKQGASVVICEADHDLDPAHLNRAIVVKSSLVFLQELARAWRKTLNDLKLIALTGSSGKTTAKELLSLGLKDLGQGAHTLGNFNNELGVPLTILRIKESDRFAIVEMGARHTGNIKFLCELANPDIGIILNIGSAHVGEFGSFEALRNCKQEMFTATRESMVAICPSDDENSLAVAKKHHTKVISFGDQKPCDIYIENVNYTDDAGLKITLKTGGEKQTLNFPIAHDSYPKHLSCVVAVRQALQMSEPLKGNAFDEYRSIPGRYYKVEKSGKTIIDDSYNANPESMNMGIQSFSRSFFAKDSALVLGDMLELGETSEELHRNTGHLVASIDPKLLVTVGKLSKSIGEGAKEEGFQGDRHLHYEKVEDLIAQQPSWPHNIFIKGSRGIALDKLIAVFDS